MAALSIAQVQKVSHLLRPMKVQVSNYALVWMKTANNVFKHIKRKDEKNINEVQIGVYYCIRDIKDSDQ